MIHLRRGHKEISVRRGGKLENDAPDTENTVGPDVNPDELIEPLDCGKKDVTACQRSVS